MLGTGLEVVVFTWGTEPCCLKIWLWTVQQCDLFVLILLYLIVLESFEFFAFRTLSDGNFVAEACR